MSKFNLEYKEELFMKKITIIPAKDSLESNSKLKVATYCRVSTECEAVSTFKLGIIPS